VEIREQKKVAALLVLGMRNDFSGNERRIVRFG
jgi:hypothetical protein